MRIEVLNEIPEDAGLRRSWNALALRMERPEIFYTYDWAIAVQHAYRDSQATIVYLAYEGESLAGVVALAKKRTGSQEVAFLAATTADYCDFLSEPGRRQEFVASVLGALRDQSVAKIVLANLPADSQTVDAVTQSAPTCKYHLHLRPAYLCARVVLGSGEERAAIKQSIVTKKRLRRNIRELEKRGAVSILHDTSWDQIEPALEHFSRAHVARFLETGKISNLIRSERRAFLYELARELSESGWIVLSRLRVSETTAAWNYGFRFAGSWFWYQPTVNETYRDFSPGYCLLAKIVEAGCDSPAVEIVDLGLGAESYKDRFATAGRQTLYCELNHSMTSHVRTALRERAAAIAKASPEVESTIRRVLSSVGRIKAKARAAGGGGLLVWLVRRMWNSIFGFEEVHFFEWDEGGRHGQSSGARLSRLDADLLGAAAIAHADEPATLDYLIRCAHRVRSRQGEGFALLDAGCKPVHFCWVANFEGFEMAELGRTLRAPAANAVMIFDCYTPFSSRGRGFFGQAITALAEQSRLRGKAPWIFSAATNQASLRGIEKTGFTQRFSLWRRKVLFRFEGSSPVSVSRPESSESRAAVP